MVAALFASIVLLGSAASVSASVGQAHVVNACDYDVKLENVPAKGGGYPDEDRTLSPGDSYSQQWTVLANKMGWSIKLYKPDMPNYPMQYEYTTTGDGQLWYDLSCVNGNPWGEDWSASSDTDSCIPSHVAYMYSTDDQHGMQPSCSISASITVTLCASNNSTSGGSSGAEPADSSAPAPAAPASESSSSDYHLLSIGGVGNILQAAEHVATPAADSTPTTLATLASPVVPVAAVVTEGPDGNVVTHVEIAYVTEVVTAFAGSRVKRHQHHPHGHQHQA